MKDIIEKAIMNLKKIQMVSKNTLKTLNKIRATIEKGDYSKISSFIDNLDFQNSMKELRLGDLYAEFKRKYDNYLGKIRLEFDKEFIEACNYFNLKNITGNSMDQFRVQGILHVKVNFSKK